MSMTIVKWISLPVLLTGSLFAHFAGTYESARMALALAAALPFGAMSQATDPLTWTGKLKYHSKSMYIRWCVGFAAYAGVLQILTLVTCYPFYFVGSAPERFVVCAHLTLFCWPGVFQA